MVQFAQWRCLAVGRGRLTVAVESTRRMEWHPGGRSGGRRLEYGVYGCLGFRSAGPAGLAFHSLREAALCLGIWRRDRHRYHGHSDVKTVSDMSTDLSLRVNVLMSLARSGYTPIAVCSSRRAKRHIHQYRESVLSTWEASFEVIENHNLGIARLLSLLSEATILSR